MDKVAMAEKLHSILRRHATNQQTTSMIAEIVPIIEEVVTAEREACVQKAALWALTKDMSSNLRLGLASAIRGRAYSADKGKQDRKGMT